MLTYVATATIHANLAMERRIATASLAKGDFYFTKALVSMCVRRNSYKKVQTVYQTAQLHVDHAVRKI